MDYIDYRERLGLSFFDKEKQQFFVTRLFSYLMNVPIKLTQKDEKRFCYQVGIQSWHDRKKLHLISLDKEFDETLGLFKIAYYIGERKKNFSDVIAMIVSFLNIYSGKKELKDTLWHDICKMLDDSHIQYELLNDNDGVFIFTKGAKELDDALVSQTLKWLSDYSDSRKAFIKALELYTNLSDSNASDVADAFRKALETFFQEFFNSDKSLEHLINEYGTFLKTKNIPALITNNLEKLLGLYTSFMNNYAKHHDRTSKNVLEFIMYQTGNIIRLLITLNCSN